MLFMEYPPSGTCKKARKWLETNNVEFTARHIKDEQPSLEELKEWHSKSGLPMRKFFNTSGKLYRELELKDKLPTMSDEEMLNLLATDGMLVKRPIAVLENKVLVGFKEAEWEENLK